MSDWYALAVGSALEQGDLLPNCPIYRVEARADETATNVEVSEEVHDVVVLTQTCDLENDKVEDVLVARVVSYQMLVDTDGERNQQLKSKGFRKAAVDGNLPAQFLLPERISAPSLDWSLVDFHYLFTIPKSLAEQAAANAGDRLRLVSPYKEHLAQGFARYVMRVGLPHTLHAFETAKPS